MPAESGRPGPGEMTMPAGLHEAMSSMVAASFRMTRTGPAELFKILHQIIGKRVIIVYHHDHGVSPMRHEV